VATDGHRLALYDVPADTEPDTADRQVIVPRKGVQELMRLLAEDEAEVMIQLSGNHVRIDPGNIRFTSKLIDGRFPDYQRAIPREGEKVLVADRQLLRAALARTVILANENRGVRLQLENWLLRLQANNPEQEEAVEEVEVNYEGGPLEIGFNAGYLLDALGASDEQLVKLSFQDANSSCLIQSAEDARGKYVISPMRL
jgi:DNA polymerase III subunit beta